MLERIYAQRWDQSQTVSLGGFDPQLGETIATVQVSDPQLGGISRSMPLRIARVGFSDVFDRRATRSNREPQHDRAGRWSTRRGGEVVIKWSHPGDNFLQQTCRRGSRSRPTPVIALPAMTIPSPSFSVSQLSGTGRDHEVRDSGRHGDPGGDGRLRIVNRIHVEICDGPTRCAITFSVESNVRARLNP